MGKYDFNYDPDGGTLEGYIDGVYEKVSYERALTYVRSRGRTTFSALVNPLNDDLRFGRTLTFAYGNVDMTLPEFHDEYMRCIAHTWYEYDTGRGPFPKAYAPYLKDKVPYEPRNAEDFAERARSFGMSEEDIEYVVREATYCEENPPWFNNGQPTIAFDLPAWCTSRDMAALGKETRWWRLGSESAMEHLMYARGSHWRDNSANIQNFVARKITEQEDRILLTVARMYRLQSYMRWSIPDYYTPLSQHYRQKAAER